MFHLLYCLHYSDYMFIPPPPQKNMYWDSRYQTYVSMDLPRHLRNKPT